MRIDHAEEELATRLTLETGLELGRARDLAFYFLQRLSEDLHNARASDPSEVALTEDNSRRLLDKFIAEMDETAPSGLCGAGIVTCAGRYRYLKGAWVCFGLLRQRGSKLPAQLWHLSSAECSPSISKAFARLDVETVDVSSVEQNPALRPDAGWPLKPYAIVHSPFQETLFLDADNVCVADPSELFLSAPYLQTGAAFWPDAERIGPDRAIWRLTGVEWRDEPEFETGQILIDKSRCWRPLLLTLYLNRYSRFYYRYIHGDKDTFHIAWRKLAVPYSMTEFPLSRLKGVVCQHDFAGRRIFQHRHIAKWDTIEHVEGFMHEQECFELCREFDSLWSAVGQTGPPE